MFFFFLFHETWQWSCKFQSHMKWQWSDLNPWILEMTKNSGHRWSGCQFALHCLTPWSWPARGDALRVLLGGKRAKCWLFAGRNTWIKTRQQPDVSVKGASVMLYHQSDLNILHVRPHSPDKHLMFRLFAPLCSDSGRTWLLWAQGRDESRGGAHIVANATRRWRSTVQYWHWSLLPSSISSTSCFRL